MPKTKSTNTKPTNTKPTNTKSKRKSRIGDPKTHFLKYTDGVFELAESETYQGLDKPSKFRCTICGDIQVISWDNLYKRVIRLKKFGRSPEDYCYRSPREAVVKEEHKPYIADFPLTILNLTSGVLKLDPDNQVFTNFTDKYDFTCTICGNVRHTNINALTNNIKRGQEFCMHREKYETVYTPPVGMTETTTEQWMDEVKTLTNGILIPKFYQPFVGVKGKYWFTCTECGRDHHLQYQVLKTRIKKGTPACKHKYYLINKNPRPGEFRIDVEELSQGYITADPNTIYVNQAEKYTYLCKCCGLTYEERFKSFLKRCKDFNPQANTDPFYPCRHFHTRIKTN